MKRLANYDIVRPYKDANTRLLVQILFGAGCAGLMILLRSAFDIWAPTSGAFALVYPTVLLATLYGHWQAGSVAYSISFLWAWYFVLPETQAFRFEFATDPPRVAINAFAALIVLIFAETFRRAVVSAMAERDLEIERRAILLQELEHRTKNNFSLAASLLELQKRREDHPQVQDALDQALNRIHSFAHAYANLAESQGEGAIVAMQPYLTELVTKVTRGAFGENINVTLNVDECELPREVAVAIGLFTNEALTNCAKYAFPDEREGWVNVSLAVEQDGWCLRVEDDGIGQSDSSSAGASSGVGTRLLDAFARQARAEYDLVVGPRGRHVSMAGAWGEDGGTGG
ncbi:two-component sensor histidine kinase [Altererythrobacter atlanticus]|uniref:histidine kinase n=1 Tax=Croceibacterium atlanticum TaxID=1267766 RepID=A0A0F7KUC2_9SPHN|nr:histidine kinase dimerization/phosphoacceptor domain -containing protein [Croceibacterium atlanticum]AKH43928.1 Blue-light-activated histidine kinase 2 [Croceibacterium atlanticum]MBB5733622.1 two-component sensor histidine kinase [Croceibacterium atlanticum]